MMQATLLSVYVVSASLSATSRDPEVRGVLLQEQHHVVTSSSVLPDDLASHTLQSNPPLAQACCSSSLPRFTDRGNVVRKTLSLKILVRPCFVSHVTTWPMLRWRSYTMKRMVGATLAAETQIFVNKLGHVEWIPSHSAEL